MSFFLGFVFGSLLTLIANYIAIKLVIKHQNNVLAKHFKMLLESK